MHIKRLLLAALALLIIGSPAAARTPKYSLTSQQAISKYNRYYNSYLRDEGVKIPQYRQSAQNIKGSLADRVIERAIWYMENGYMVYGSYSPNGYLHYGITDCSNFTKLVFGDFGINFTSTAKKYNTVGVPVNGVYPVKKGSTWTVKGTENLRPGDIMTWYNTDSSGRKYISHVAIYMGMLNGQPAVIGTRSTGNPTAIGIVNSFKYWWGSNLFSVRRVLPEGSWTPSATPSGYKDNGPVKPEHYRLPPQRPVPATK